MSGSRSRFHEIVESKGWQLKEIRQRWGLSERQMSRIAKNPTVIHLDAISNLPNKDSATSKQSEVVASSTWLTPENHAKLCQLAKLNSMSTDDYLAGLLAENEKRHELLEYANEKGVFDANLPEVHEINQVINDELQHLQPESEVYQYQQTIEQMYHRLLSERLISTKVTKGRIAESERLKIPRVAYYWYGGSIAKACARWFNTDKVYLWHELYYSESEVIFVGSSENVVVSYQVCSRLCQLFKKAKSNYKKSIGDWGTNKEREDEANDRMNLFARGVAEASCGYHDEDCFSEIYDYIEDKYLYTLR